MRAAGRFTIFNPQLEFHALKTFATGTLELERVRLGGISPSAKFQQVSVRQVRPSHSAFHSFSNTKMDAPNTHGQWGHNSTTHTLGLFTRLRRHRRSTRRVLFPGALLR